MPMCVASWPRQEAYVPSLPVRCSATALVSKLRTSNICLNSSTRFLLSWANSGKSSRTRRPSAPRYCRYSISNVATVGMPRLLGNRPTIPARAGGLATPEGKTLVSADAGAASARILHGDIGSRAIRGWRLFRRAGDIHRRKEKRGQGRVFPDTLPRRSVAAIDRLLRHAVARHAQGQRSEVIAGIGIRGQRTGVGLEHDIGIAVGELRREIEADGVVRAGRVGRGEIAIHGAAFRRIGDHRTFVQVVAIDHRPAKRRLRQVHGDLERTEFGRETAGVLDRDLVVRTLADLQGAALRSGDGHAQIGTGNYRDIGR